MLSPSFINSVSTKAFEKKIVNICRDILFVVVPILHIQDSSVKSYHISKDININKQSPFQK